MKKKLFSIVFCILIISGTFMYKKYDQYSPQFIVNNYLFSVNTEQSLTSNQVKSLKGKQIGQTKKHTLSNPKNHGEGFKVPTNSSIFLVNRDNLMVDSNFKDRFQQTKGSDTLLIKIDNKYYISKFVVPDVSKYYYLGELKKFVSDFYKEQDFQMKI